MLTLFTYIVWLFHLFINIDAVMLFYLEQHEVIFPCSWIIAGVWKTLINLHDLPGILFFGLDGVHPQQHSLNSAWAKYIMSVKNEDFCWHMFWNVVIMVTHFLQWAAVRTHDLSISIPPQCGLVISSRAMYGSEWGVTSFPSIISEPSPKTKIQMIH